MLIIPKTEENELFLTKLCLKFQAELNSISLPNDIFKLIPFFSETTGGYWNIHIFLDNKSSRFSHRYWYHCHSCQIWGKNPPLYREYHYVINKIENHLREQFSE